MRKTVQTTLAGILFLSMLASIGCSNIRSPRFETLGVREVEQTESRTVYAFVVKATNPNKEPIPLREVAYTVTLDGNHSFSGVRSPETTLHTYGNHTFALPAVSEFGPGEVTGIIDYTLNGTAKYLKPGKLAEVMFDSKVSVPKAGFHLRGQVDVDDPNRD